MNRFVALDFETSGLDPKRHAPVSLGVALMEGLDVIDSREWRFAPPTDKNGRITREYDAFALEISGNTIETVKAGKPIATVMSDFSKWAKLHNCQGSTVVAFNAPFDLAFYSECLFLGGSWNQHTRSFESSQPPLHGPWQCVRLMAVNIVRCGRYNLDTVAARFGFSREGTKHGAIEDAILAGKIYASLIGGQENSRSESTGESGENLTPAQEAQEDDYDPFA